MNDKTAQISSITVGPVFITTVYPVSQIDNQIVELTDPIKDAYSFAGRSLISRRFMTEYFPTPLSYPYQFSEAGLERLKQELSNHQSVDSETVEVKTFSNIYRDQQHEFPKDKLKELLIEEKYISFKLKEWQDALFMKFPTFVTLSFDHTEQINKFDQYREICSSWRTRYDEFRSMEDLWEILGIYRGEHSNIPILTFVSLQPDPFLDEDRLANRLISGSRDIPSLIRQLSFRELPGDGHGLFCFDLIYEYMESLISNLRFYYGTHPPFYTGKRWHFKSSTGTRGARGSANRILRVALFVNVTHPSMSRRGEALDHELKRNTSELQAERLNRLDDFSLTKLDSLASFLSETIRRRDLIASITKRLEETQAGYNQLIDFMKDPWMPPPSEGMGDHIPVHDITPDHRCLDLFDFRKRMNIKTDKEKANSTGRALGNCLNAITRGVDQLDKQILSVAELLENRRNMRQSQLNMLVSIGLPAVGAFFVAFILWVIWFVLRK